MFIEYILIGLIQKREINRLCFIRREKVYTQLILICKYFFKRAINIKNLISKYRIKNLESIIIIVNTLLINIHNFFLQNLKILKVFISTVKALRD